MKSEINLLKKKNIEELIYEDKLIRTNNQESVIKIFNHFGLVGGILINILNRNKKLYVNKLLDDSLNCPIKSVKLIKGFYIIKF